MFTFTFHLKNSEEKMLMAGTNREKNLEILLCIKFWVLFFEELQF